MRSAVIVFPGSNCDRDAQTALRRITGTEPAMVWHKESALPAGTDLVVVPGGFSYGDYLRCGAIAARAPVMRDVVRHAEAGGTVMGICNGFQVLQEAGLLPGALMRNHSLRFACRPVTLRVETVESPFTAACGNRRLLTMPVAHHDGNFIADDSTRAALEAEGRIAFRYTDAAGETTEAANPNGSLDNIAGILSANRRVLGIMPHPERAADAALGSEDGALIFQSLAESLATA